MTLASNSTLTSEKYKLFPTWLKTAFLSLCINQRCGIQFLEFQFIIALLRILETKTTHLNCELNCISAELQYEHCRFGLFQCCLTFRASCNMFHQVYITKNYIALCTPITGNLQ
uniref:Uncharacterized protein n=1 Tax=Micrurus surinamensis TaxID=129470 RepID=A0A2D4PBA2_MICSU